jgi:hypothetical protein
VLAGCEAPVSAVGGSRQAAETAGDDASGPEAQEATGLDASPEDAAPTLADDAAIAPQASPEDAALVAPKLADAADDAGLAVFACGSTYCVSGIQVCNQVTGCNGYTVCSSAPLDGGDPCAGMSGCTVDVLGNATIAEFRSECPACYGAPPPRRTRRGTDSALARA